MSEHQTAFSFVDEFGDHFLLGDEDAACATAGDAAHRLEVAH
jgi:hypothetical protein